mmetsp:Transcript_9380/g.8167  ORF Transcript_9380/g.8167 Transcript_9380/m.8167 type:complete len:85 (-) Transcript_9380:44-298(-)
MFDDHYSLTFQYVDDEQDSTKAADASHIILELDIQYNDDIRAEWEALGFFVAYNDEDEEDEKKEEESKQDDDGFVMVTKKGKKK